MNFYEQYPESSGFIAWLSKKFETFADLNDEYAQALRETFIIDDKELSFYSKNELNELIEIVYEYVASNTIGSIYSIEAENDNNYLQYCWDRDRG